MLAALLAVGLMQSPTSMSAQVQPATATQTGEATMSVSEIPQLEIKGEAGDVEAQVKLAPTAQPNARFVRHCSGLDKFWSGRVDRE
jgi:hypothetical protein